MNTEHRTLTFRQDTEGNLPAVLEFEAAARKVLDALTPVEIADIEFAAVSLEQAARVVRHVARMAGGERTAGAIQ